MEPMSPIVKFLEHTRSSNRSWLPYLVLRAIGYFVVFIVLLFQPRPPDWLSLRETGREIVEDNAEKSLRAIFRAAD